METFLFGCICGLIIGIFIPKDRTINQIKKLKTKGDNSPIDIAQEKEKKERKGIFRKIFKRKKR